MTNNTIDYKTEYLKLKAQAEANEAFFYKKYNFLFILCGSSK